MNDSPEYTRDTIVAAATPPGKGGIGVVRISGPDAAKIANRVLGKIPEARYATFSGFRDAEGAVLDRGIALWFPAPHSFTGESVLELHGHGGPQVISLIIDTAVALGARRAEPGEFSKRAYLNGRLDLSQAEAIVDLIEAGTAQAARAAYRSLSGTFSDAISALTEKLIGLRMHVEAAIDFPEEEIDFLSDAALLQRIDDCRASFNVLLKGATAGRVLRDGFQVVIVGKPNAGKSSLLNLLSGQEAAIVTEIAGTTRDILRERIEIDGLAVELVDTAGLREDPDRIEAEGIRRARRALANADAVMWIRDASTGEDDGLEEEIPCDVPLIQLRNKIDLTNESPGVVSMEPPVLNVSAMTGAGVDDLRSILKQTAGYEDLGEGAFTARQRHLVALREARTHFDRGERALMDERAGEILAEELRLAQESLALINGQFTSDDLLGRIFAEFCIGK